MIWGAELGLDYNKPYRKSARIVGDTMGKFHPHGDSSIYDAMVVMAQDFKREIPLVDGHGNFGSIEGDEPLLHDTQKQGCRRLHRKITWLTWTRKLLIMSRTMTRQKKNRRFCRQRFQTLINGSEGIAVGMTTQLRRITWWKF